jgi:hypothetical protein
MNPITENWQRLFPAALSGVYLLQGGLDKQHPGVKMKHVADILEEK